MADKKETKDTKKEPDKGNDIQKTTEQLEQEAKHPPTGYFSTFVHLVKGTVGAGMFAMGEAIMNCGILVGPPLIIVIGIACIHCQHVLVNCSIKVKENYQMESFYDYSDTIKCCFELGPEKYRKMANGMGVLVNVFICTAQFGFCCIYLVFIGTNLQQILAFYDIEMEVPYLILIVFVPVWMACLITNLKYLTPVSLIADILLIFGVLSCIGFAIEGEKQNYSDMNKTNDATNMALFFGTLLFAYESIALVLPLRNAMKNPHDFDRKMGVLNVASFFITFSYMVMGAVSYWRWGNEIKGSVTLNLGDNW